MNTALSKVPVGSTTALQDFLQDILGPCSFALQLGDLYGFTRHKGTDGLYVLDTGNGNLFFEPVRGASLSADQVDRTRLERALFDRKIKLACMRAESLTLEDGYERMGGDVERLAAGLDPTLEIFDLGQPNAALPLAQVQAAARFNAHPSLPIIAISQPAHTSECAPVGWQHTSPRRAG